MEDTTEKSWTEIILGLVLMFPLMLWRGFVFGKLWAWYLLPIGAPPISLWQGLGIWLIVKYATFHQDDKVDNRPREKWVKKTLVEWLIPAIYLLIAWIYNHFI